MRGKLARVLRRLIGFDPHKKRDYMRTTNGIIFETSKTEDGKDSILTKRSLYRISKKMYVNPEDITKVKNEENN